MYATQEEHDNSPLIQGTIPQEVGQHSTLKALMLENDNIATDREDPNATTTPMYSLGNALAATSSITGLEIANHYFDKP